MSQSIGFNHVATSRLIVLPPTALHVRSPVDSPDQNIEHTLPTEATKQLRRTGLHNGIQNWCARTQLVIVGKMCRRGRSQLIVLYDLKRTSSAFRPFDTPQKPKYTALGISFKTPMHRRKSAQFNCSTSEQTRLYGLNLLATASNLLLWASEDPKIRLRSTCPKL